MIESITEDFLHVKSKTSPQGVSCFFVQLDENTGIKCYHNNRDERDFCVEMQQFAHKADLGPKVGKTFNIGKYWCYVTQVIDPLFAPEWGKCLNVKVFNECGTYPRNNAPNYCRGVSEKYLGTSSICTRCTAYTCLQSIFKQEIRDLEQDIKDWFGHYHEDLHLCNIGWMNNRLVCLDFGSDGLA